MDKYIAEGDNRPVEAIFLDTKEKLLDLVIYMLDSKFIQVAKHMSRGRSSISNYVELCYSRGYICFSMHGADCAFNLNQWFIFREPDYLYTASKENFGRLYKKQLISIEERLEELTTDQMLNLLPAKYPGEDCISSKLVINKYELTWSCYYTCHFTKYSKNEDIVYYSEAKSLKDAISGTLINLIKMNQISL